MNPLVALIAAAVALPGPAYAQQRGLNLQTAPRPQPFLSAPNSSPREAPLLPGPSYDLAPTPNRDLDAPAGPRASAAPQLAPSLFTRGQQYRGEGFSSGSTAQAEQERRAQPGAGFKLRLPLRQQ